MPVDIFGGSLSPRGYRLPPRVGLIYGDSITLAGSGDLSRLAAKGFASSNVVLGIGSYTYQYLTRDSFGWAMKATYGVVQGSPRELFKDPVTTAHQALRPRPAAGGEGRRTLRAARPPEPAGGEGASQPIFRRRQAPG